MKLFGFYSPGEYADFYIMASSEEKARKILAKEYPGHKMTLRQAVGVNEVIAVFE